LRHGYVCARPLPKSNGDGDDNKPVEESMSVDDRIGVTIGSNAQKLALALKWLLNGGHMLHINIYASIQIFLFDKTTLHDRFAYSKTTNTSI
jgi:hypothetical protein